jgi:polyisoprenyl-phosphate glycosyltransferase
MHQTFISIVGVIHSGYEVSLLSEYLTNMHGVLKANFRDYELILVNNTQQLDVEAKIRPLDAEVRQHIFMLNLSMVVNKNHAILAGLDRANGDYTVLWEFHFSQQAHLVVDLYEKTQAHHDIVYLRATGRQGQKRWRVFYRLFYFILQKYSELDIDPKAHNTRIISRRALNSLLRLRENLRYMKALYSMVGYRTANIEVAEPLPIDPEETFTERFRTFLIAVTSFTNFLRSMLLAIFLFSLFFLIFVVTNALKVKFSGSDLFGTAQHAVGGWTYLVILISVFFAVTCLNLYIISIYLSNIYNEIKNRPLYIIESSKRF